MSLQKAKATVTSYFRGRRAALRLLNGRGIRAGSDFFELYVLVRLAIMANGVVVPTVKANGTRVFLVAGSPSPSWSAASHILINGRAARTGLQVQCTPGSVELDVVIIDQSLVTPSDQVPAAASQAGFECKALRGKIKTTHANEIIGKALRVWGGVPLAQRTSGTATSNRYSGVSLNGATGGLDALLAAYGIGLAVDLQELDQLVQELIPTI